MAPERGQHPYSGECSDTLTQPSQGVLHGGGKKTHAEEYKKGGTCTSQAPPLYITLFLQLKQPANYPLRAPRPPRFDSVARFNVVKRSSLSFKKRAIFCSKFSFG